ncbi:MAG: hypothetical protein HF312_15430 [Ignavibacteria bacterium]|jgi:hypothetical protein|nr:hypothetical protein [Ignavibacteria bacterium]
MAKDIYFSQVFAPGNKLTAQAVNTMQGEAQAEFERRVDELFSDGVLTADGFAPSIVGTSLDFSAGVLYFLGKRYHGPITYPFPAVNAGLYYVYIDDSTGALAVSLTAPVSTTGFLLCTVSWDGSTTLTNLVDQRTYISPTGAGAPGSEIYGKTKVSSNDTNYGNLKDKIVAGNNITVVEVNDGGNETLQISGDTVDTDTKQVKIDVDDTEGYLGAKLVAGYGVTIVNSGTAPKTLTISAPNSGDIATTTITDYQDIAVSEGEKLYVVWDHSDQATFTKALETQAWLEINGSNVPGFRVTQLAQMPNGDKTNGSQVCFLIERVAVNGYYY